MESYYPIPPKTWFQRNKKWFVPTLVIGIISLFVLFVAGFVFGIMSILKNSDVCQHSMAVAKKNKYVIEKIGSKIEENGLVAGSISTHNYSGEAQLDIPIKGTKGEGLIHVEAEKKNNIWIYNILDFYPAGSSEPTSLLDNNP